MLSYLKLASDFFRVTKSDTDKYLGYKNLEHYGVIGNLETCALVAFNGSIDWLCLPHLESASVFGSLLDKEKGGYFVVQPKGSFDTHQKYIERSNVLQTIFRTKSGEATLTDFMMPFKKNSSWHKHQVVFRKIQCTKGVVACTADCAPKFQYGKLRPRWK